MTHLNRRGITLVEVLAAIVILTFILTSTLSLLLSTAKSTQQSRSVVEYSLIAQSRTEAVFEAVSDATQLTIGDVMTDPPMSYSTDSENDMEFFKNQTDVNGRSYEVRVTFTDYVSEDEQFDYAAGDEHFDFEELSGKLSSVLVEVTRDGASHPKAIIETIMEWGG